MCTSPGRVCCEGGVTWEIVRCSGAPRTGERSEDEDLLAQHFSIGVAFRDESERQQPGYEERWLPDNLRERTNPQQRNESWWIERARQPKCHRSDIEKHREDAWDSIPDEAWVQEGAPVSEHHLEFSTILR